MIVIIIFRTRSNASYNDFHYQYAEDSMLVLRKCVPQGRLCVLGVAVINEHYEINSFHKNSWDNFHSRENLRVAHTDTNEGTDVTGQI
jgi:hypothetical protein